MVANPGVLVPQLDIDAPLFTPILVEVDEEIQPAMEATVLDVIEVGVHIKVAARAGLIDPASDQFLVGQKPVNSEHMSPQ